MDKPRLMVAAPSSGSGKTMVTCGLLRALQRKGKRPSAFKCGPDYIDPMFHQQVLKVPSKNLDSFFVPEQRLQQLFLDGSRETDLAVIEGVMGYYDGIGGTSCRASSYDVAARIETPVILVVDSKGISLSVIALIQGFLSYQKPSYIKGVIFNRMSAMLYPRIKAETEKQTGITVLGFVPEMQEAETASRHLGLLMPHEIELFDEKISGIADVLEKTVDIEGIIALAGTAPPLAEQEQEASGETSGAMLGIARDAAFNFYYEDNLQLLKKAGAKIKYFSPLKDKRLPDGINGLIIGGGYPENYAGELEGNRSLRLDIKGKIESGMPCLAECGGFLYLHSQLEGADKRFYDMVGVIPARAWKAERLGPFGYLELELQKDTVLGETGTTIKGHEYHYYRSGNNGTAARAVKPTGDREWPCMHGTDTLLAGFPHLFYYSEPEAILHFLNKCVAYKE